MSKPILKLYECGCTSGHDSLIRLWVPEYFTQDDLEHVKAIWDLMLRQLERGVVSEKDETLTKQIDKKV